MTRETLFVGSIAIGLGSTALYAAVRNGDWCFRLRLFRWIDRQWGRGAARLASAGLGTLLIALGVAIAFDWRPLWPV